MDQIPPTYPEAKRFTARRLTWRRPDTLFSPTGFAVDGIEPSKARLFLQTHHYLGDSFPAARLSIGLFHQTPVAPAELVGVAVFAQPSNNQTTLSYTGLHHSQGPDLARFVLNESIPYNGETWFLARAIRLLRQEKPETETFTASSDPLEWRDPTGGLIKRSHAGGIYVASNALYHGSSNARTVTFAPSGLVLNQIMLDKITLERQGIDYATGKLLAAGAEPRLCGESPRDWVKRVTTQAPFRKFRHPGNHVFSFPLTDVARAAALAASRPPQAYQKGLPIMRHN